MLSLFLILLDEIHLFFSRVRRRQFDKVMLRINYVAAFVLSLDQALSYFLKDYIFFY